MTGPRAPHPEYEELISASLAGDLTDQERRRLDAHLDGCEACRGVLASFADGRRIVAGLRHVPVPRDLHARIRTGIATGRLAELPWWRRPAVIFAGIGGSLAAVAGALLALVILNQPPAPVGNATPTPTPSPAASSTPSPTATSIVVPSPTPPTSVAPSATPSEPAETPEPTTVATGPEPDVYLGHTGPFDNRAVVVADGATGEGITEDSTAPGPPIAAELSPDGQWVAYLARVGEKGTHEVRVTRIAEPSQADDPDAPEPIDSPIPVGETRVLGESLSGDPFIEHIAWSAPSGRYLAFTMADPESGDTDAWLFDTSIGEAGQVTDTGNAYVGSWIPDGGGSSLLWLSVAAERPTSYLHAFDDAVEGEFAPIDPADDPIAMAEGVFQPLLNVSGRFAIYWDGAMERIGPDDGSVSGWRFVSGAEPYLAEHIWESEEVRFTDERAVFSDLTVDRDGFTSASITWGPDGDTYAIWDARWTGSPQSGSGEPPYPDERRIYFSRATDARGMTRGQAIDAGDVPEDWYVADVKIAPTGEHLVITAARPLGGALDAPEADLLLVQRNFGDVADEVTVLRGEEDTNWWGPAAYDDR